MRCGYDDPKEGPTYRGYSDQQIPIWQNSQIIYPSIYISTDLSHNEAKAMIRNTVSESLRCAKNGETEDGVIPDVYPYMWQYYHGGQSLLDNEDLKSAITIPYEMGAQGIINWGSCEPPNETEWWLYVNYTSGPMVELFVDEVNDCAGVYCNNHGRCASLDNTTCICDPGYSGNSCNTPFFK